MLDVRNRLRGREGVLLAGDLVGFLAFAVLGLRSHEDGITVESVARAAVPFMVGWVVVSLALQRPGDDPFDARKIARLWVPAWALGLILRTVFFDRSFEPAFAVVSLLVIGVILMLWRSWLAPLILRRG
jgi:hypothetical protein